MEVGCEEPLRSSLARGGPSTTPGSAPWLAVFALSLPLFGCDARQVAVADGAADAATTVVDRGGVDSGADRSRDLPSGEVQTDCLETLRSGSTALPCDFSPATYTSCHVRDECCAARAACYQHQTQRQPLECRAGRSTACPGVALELSLTPPSGPRTLSKVWLTLGVGFHRYLTLTFADGATLETCVTPRLSVDGDLVLGTQALLALFATDGDTAITAATLTLTELPAGGSGPWRVSGSLSIPAWKVDALSFSLGDCAELRTSGS